MKRNRWLLAAGILVAAILIGAGVIRQVTAARTAAEKLAREVSPLITDKVPADARIPGWRLVWHDEFDGPNGAQPDPTRWSYQLGTGYGNHELQYYTDRTENAYQQDGKLILKAIQEKYKNANYTSARLITQHKGDWKYGRVAVKAQLPHGQGLQGIWPAIWMMPTDSKYGHWPASGEIDILEMIGKDPLTAVGTIHFGNPHKAAGKTYKLPDDGFHEYALEWEPGEIRWYVDGNLYETRKAAEWFSSGGPAPAPFDQQFYLILNVAVGGNWPGAPDATSIFPQAMEVEYVRVYEPAPAPAK